MPSTLGKLRRLFAFHLLLRGGELAGLKVGDVVFAEDAKVGKRDGSAVVVLHKTKTGPNQSVTVLDERVVSLLLGEGPEGGEEPGSGARTSSCCRT